MVDVDEVIPRLVAVLPSFADRWAELEPDVEDDGTRLHYADAGEVARHLVQLLRDGNVAELQAAFEVIEELHRDPDDGVRQLATLGLLEGVQNIASHADDVSAAAFEPYLGPASRQAWDDLNRFWSGD